MEKKQKKLSQTKQEEILKELEKQFSNASSWDSEWRDNAEVWYQYYHGVQWSSEETEALQDRGQAVSTYNYIKPSIDSIIGSERRNRPKVSMAGRGLSDQKLAEAKTKLYNYITYNTKTDDETDKMIRDALVTGRGWMYIYGEIGAGNSDVKHTYVDYRDMFIDPMSKKDNLDDCRHVHYGVYTDEDIIAQQFPDYKTSKKGGESNSGSFSFEGSSDDNIWYYGEDRQRPRLINSWYRNEKGNIVTAVWVKGQLLYYKENPYKFNKLPFVQYCLDRNLDNFPYGYVKQMISPQDEINKRHSKALHYLNAKQVLAEEDAFSDFEEAKKTLARPDGITKLSDGALKEGKVQIIDNTVLANTHIQMMQIARENIRSLVGINEAFMGQGSDYASSKQTNSQISQALNSIIPILNKLRICRYDLAYITMKLVPTFYAEKRVIRILEEDGSYAFMPINEMKLLDDGTLAKINDMTTDDVDIIIEDAPASLNEREEQFALLMQIQGQTSRPIPMEVLLRYSSIKSKYQLASDLESHYNLESQLEQAGQTIEQQQKQMQDMQGQMEQLKSQIVQLDTKIQVDKEVYKVKEKLKEDALELGVKT